MSRPILSSEKVTSEASKYTSEYHASTVKEVVTAVEGNKIVVVGMASNPFVKKACKALQEASKDFKYLEYGSYFSLWKPRLAIKMWSGWPTFPQIFVDGKLVGGYQELKAKLDKKEI
jgi:glutaredoxin-related protein